MVYKSCPDTLLYNGKIISEHGTVSALSIKGDTILELGDDQSILSTACKSTKVYNLQGRTVIPGIIESHAHFAQAALSELNGELFIPSSVKELLEYVKRRVKAVKKGEWLYFRNTYPSRLSERRFPTLQELDEAAPDNPIFIDAAYAGQANSCALRLCSIDESTSPVGGKVCIDSGTGKPNGTLFTCCQLVRRHIGAPAFTGDDIVRAVEILQKEYGRLGITSVIDGSTSPQQINAYSRMYGSGRLNVRLIFTCPTSEIANTDKDIKALREAVNMPPEWGKLGFLKVTLDGGILTGTSFMRKPYGVNGRLFGIDDSSYRGMILYDADQLKEFIVKACENNLQMCAHCVGDAACDIFLDAYEKIDTTIPIAQRRFSIIHADFTDDFTLDRVKRLGLTLISQPAWHYMDGSVFKDILDGETLKSFLPYSSMCSKGIHTCAGSDHMVKHNSYLSQNPYNPFVGIYNLVTRKTRSGDKVCPEQRISREEALMLYTQGGAYVSFDEERKGAIGTGKLADLTVLSKDILTCPEREIPSIESVLTLVGGKVTYAAIEAEKDF